MRRPGIIIFILICALQTRAQSPVSVKYLDTLPGLYKAASPLFGGISALAYMPENFIFKNGKQTTSLLLFSDHTPNKPQPGIAQRTVVFRYDIKNKKLQDSPHAFDSSGQSVINSVECVRYSKALNSIFYCYEEDDRTGIVWMHSNISADTICERSLPYDNRGIEGITLAADTSLWYALESGDGSNNYSVPFVRIPFVNGRYDTAGKIVYQYPFDKCSCLTDAQCPHFNGSTGSGVSEILALPEDMGTGFLVLERCFNDTAAYVRLFYAATDGRKSRLLSKSLLMDFNEAKLRPDNLEGMAWEPGSGKERILDIISDDNYNKKHQRTQCIRLKVMKMIKN